VEKPPGLVSKALRRWLSALIVHVAPSALKSGGDACGKTLPRIRRFHIANDGLPAVIDVDVLDVDVLMTAVT
jgi:hypothetical protein